MNTQTIDFGELLPVVRELDSLRFGSLLSESDVARLRELQHVFSLMTHDRKTPPKMFVSDGCTLSTDAFGQECCVLHDLAYWLGGTRAEKLAADQRVYVCTKQKSRWYAPIQYFGVRIGGGRFVPDFILNKQFRWGFGWDYPAPGEPGIVY